MKGKTLSPPPHTPRPLTCSLTLACPPSSLAWVEPLLILYQSSNPLYWAQDSCGLIVMQSLGFSHQRL